MPSNIAPYSKQLNMRSAPSSQSAIPKETATGDHTYLIWQERIRQTLQWRKSRYDKDWQRAYRMYNGVHWRDMVETDPSSDQARDRITVNVTMTNVLNIVPFLLNNDPTFVCKPRQPNKDQVAKLQSEILNYEYQQRDMHAQVTKAIYDVVEIGHGIAKVGYVLELDEAVHKADGVINYDSYIKEDAPFVKRICPFYFLIDPAASENNLETARWCAEIFFQPLRDVCANQRYNQSVLSKIKKGLYTPATKTTIFDNLADAGFDALKVEGKDLSSQVQTDNDPVVLYEVWDKKHRKYFIFAAEVPEPLLEKDWPYEYIDNFPYIKCDYIPIQDELYGVGIPYTIEDQQFELNRIRTSAFEHRRRFNRKYTALEGSVDTQEALKLINGEDGTVIYVKTQNAILPLQDAPLSQDTLIVEGMIKEDISKTTGSDDLISGGRLPSRTTQGEVQTRANLYRLKLEERAKAVDKFILKIGTQVLQHIKNNYRTERIIAIVGLRGVNWETLSSEDIKEEVDVSMESVSAPKVDPMVDRQQRAFIWQTAMQALPLVQAGILNIDFNQLFAWVMESYGYKDIGRFFNFDLIVQPPLQQQMPQQQGQAVGQSAQPADQMQQNGFGALFGQMNGAVQ